MSRKQDLFEKGYLKFPSVVPTNMLNEVIIDIFNHTLGALTSHGMVEMYHYQSMWTIRQWPALHDIFSELFQTEKLWVSIDRVSAKKPIEKPEQEQLEYGFIHWDLCPNQKPRPFEVQGVLALGDTTEEMGGFQCLPELYQHLDEWLASLPTKKALTPSFALKDGKAKNHTRYYLTETEDPPEEWPIEKVPAKAGDLIVWDSFLPHGNGMNYGLEPRLALYVTMIPVGDERTRQERVECWQTNSPPSGWAFPGDPRQLEQKKEPAQLSELGRKLLGAEGW